MFRSDRGSIHIVIFNPFINLLILTYTILVLINEFHKFDPPGLFKYFVDIYFITFFPIVLGFAITPVRLSEEPIKRLAKIVVIFVRVCVPLIFLFS